MTDHWSTAAGSRDAGSVTADRETIALLEEEIARLEDELRLRDLAAAAEVQDFAADRSPIKSDDAAEARVSQLCAALEAREETISLLLEQVRLAEEADAASRAEWEQLHQWVQEVERRVAAQEQPDSDLGSQLAAERQNSQLLRQATEKEQRSWEVQRQGLVTEVERLRARLTEVASQSDGSIAAVRALEQENDKLREAYNHLASYTVHARERDAAVQELEALRQQHAALVLELKKQRDDWQRQRNEYEASANALRAQLARDSLRRQEEQVKATGVGLAPGESSLEADMRIRALREHLKEIHDGESEQRMRRSLAVRLSRLWSHTSAKP
jgi:hypothetical protein